MNGYDDTSSNSDTGGGDDITILTDISHLNEISTDDDDIDVNDDKTSIGLKNNSNLNAHISESSSEEHNTRFISPDIGLYSSDNDDDDNSSDNDYFEYQKQPQHINNPDKKANNYNQYSKDNEDYDEEEMEKSQHQLTREAYHMNIREEYNSPIKYVSFSEETEDNLTKEVETGALQYRGSNNRNKANSDMLNSIKIDAPNVYIKPDITTTTISADSINSLSSSIMSKKEEEEEDSINEDYTGPLMEEDEYGGITKSIKKYIKGKGRKIRKRIISKKKPRVLSSYRGRNDKFGFNGLMSKLESDPIYNLGQDSDNFSTKLQTTSSIEISVSGLSSRLRRVIPRRLAKKTVEATIHNITGTGSLGNIDRGDQVFHFRNLTSLNISKADVIRSEFVPETGTSQKQGRWRSKVIDMEFVSPLTNKKDSFFYRLFTGRGTDEDMNYPVWYNRITESDKEFSIIMRFQDTILTKSSLLKDIYLIYKSEKVTKQRLRSFIGSDHGRYDFAKEIGYERSQLCSPVIGLSSLSNSNSNIDLSIAENSLARFINQESVSFITSKKNGYNANVRINALLSPYIYSYMDQNISKREFSKRSEHITDLFTSILFLTMGASKEYNISLNIPNLNPDENESYDDNDFDYSNEIPSDMIKIFSPAKETSNKVSRILTEYSHYSVKCNDQVELQKDKFTFHRAKNIFGVVLKNLLIKTNNNMNNSLNAINTICSYMLKITNEIGLNAKSSSSFNHYSKEIEIYEIESQNKKKY